MVAEAAVWKDAGGCMEGCWRLYRRMLAAVWKDVGGCMEGCWRLYGRMLAAVWKDVGGCMEGCWWLYGRMLAAMKEGRYVERWRLRYRLFVCLNFVLYGFEKSLFLFQMQCYLN